jgi:hypothetical protein
MILLEVDVAGATLRYSDAPYAGGGTPGCVEERMLDTSRLDRRLVRGAHGRIILGNLDGRLDGWTRPALTGQSVRLLAGAADDDYCRFVPLFTGLVDGADIGRDEVVLDVCDPLALDDEPGLSRVAAQAKAWLGCDSLGRLRLWPMQPIGTQAPALVWDAAAVRREGDRGWRTSIDLAAPPPSALDLGAVVAVGSRHLLVSGLTLRPVSRTLEVTLWG